MSNKLIEVRNSPIHGRGVFAVKAIKKGTRIIEYKGARMTQKESDKVYGGTSDTGHTFLFTLNDYYVIDANQGGNAARWINHGCKPNCESETEEDDSGRPEKERVFIHAIRNIKPGEELTYNYLHHPRRAAHQTHEENLAVLVRREKMHRHDAGRQGRLAGLVRRQPAHCCEKPASARRMAAGAILLRCASSGACRCAAPTRSAITPPTWAPKRLARRSAMFSFSV